MTVEQRLLALIAEARLSPLDAPWTTKDSPSGLLFEEDGTITAWETSPEGFVHIVQSSPDPDDVKKEP